MVLTTQMPSVGLIRCRDRDWQHIWYLQNNGFLYDLSGSQTMSPYLVLRTQMPSEWLISHTYTNCQQTGYLQNKCLLYDSSGVGTWNDNILATYKTNAFCMDEQGQTPNVNMLGTYETVAFCMTHQAYRNWLGNVLHTYINVWNVYMCMVCFCVFFMKQGGDGLFLYILYETRRKKENLMWRLCLSIYYLQVTVTKPPATFWWITYIKPLHWASG